MSRSFQAAKAVAPWLVLPLLALASACSSGGSQAVETPTTGQSFDASLTYFGGNIFSAGTPSVTPATCEDPLADAQETPGASDYLDAVYEESCFQSGAIPFTPPVHDCDDGVAPEAPDEREAIAGGRVVFDIRTLEIVTVSQIIEECIPIGE